MFKTGFIKINKGENKQVKTPKASDDRGVVYLGHVPHGFQENEMKQYFTQFGEVTNINIPKSKKTGGARGFAFIEFLYPEVAQVVAETMNNYLMHKKILVAKYIPSSQVKSNTFWRSNKNKIPLTIKNRSIQRKANDRLLNPDQEKKCQALLNKRLRSLQKKLKANGIEYEIQTFNPESSAITEASTDLSANKDNDNSASDTCSNQSMDSSIEEKKVVRSKARIAKIAKIKTKSKLGKKL